MYHWLSSNKRKKHQRRINHAVAEVNKVIENDNLWRGRFVIRQDCAHWLPYEDNSGWALYVGLKFIDKKTGFVWNRRLESVNSLCALNAYRLWNEMNDFIVEKCDVWGREGRDVLWADKTDWTKVKI